jgi:hypothetical protein
MAFVGQSLRLDMRGKINYFSERSSERTVAFNFNCVSYMLLWSGLFSLSFKGTVARDCRPLVFSIIDPIWAPDSHPKIFLKSVSNSQRYLDLYVYQHCRIQHCFKFYFKIGKDFYFYLFDLGVLLHNLL